jgi:2'-5' RNA ligase
MRLFVAVDLSPETRDQVRALRQQLESRLTGRRSPRLTWAKPEAAHVTLAFLGEMPDRAVDRLVAALGSSRLPGGRFDVSWNAVGAFPNHRKPRVLWLGATDGAESLTSLAQVVRERLEGMAVAGVDRAFQPHVTIARVRDPGTGVTWSEALSQVRPGHTTSHVDHVTLYRSQLSPKGPHYSPLAAFEL